MGTIVSKKKRQESDFYEAVVGDQSGAASDLIRANPDLVNCTFHGGITNAMCRATYMGNKNIILVLLKHGANPNITSSDDRSPLHWAAFRGFVDIMEILIDAGADPSLLDKDGLTCFELALIRVQYGPVKYGWDKCNFRPPKEKEEYLELAQSKFDIDLFYQYLENGRDDPKNRDIFFEKIW